MYSVVLMTALTAGSIAPQWGHGYGGYAGYSNYGCSGCYGCYGGYSGWGCGCSCGGAWTFGGYGFAGGGYGYHGGCYGGYGNWYGGPYYGSCSGCYGCHGGYSGYGIPVPVTEVFVPKDKEPTEAFPPINPKKDDKGVKQPEEVNVPKEKKPDAPKIDKKEVEKKLEENKQSRAKVRIDVPQGGKLFVDGQRINVPAGLRTFQTPPLARGQKFFYDIRIEVERNGQVLSDQRRVIIESGQVVALAFPNLSPKGTALVQANE